MHGMHARLPKNFVLEERLERYADHIELKPQTWSGIWAEACWPESGAAGSFSEVRLDLGCGKGSFLAESARREPQVLFVGIDAEPLCMAYAAQRIHEGNLHNAVVVPGLGSLIPRIFSEHELSVIHLNFPTPYPRKKDANKRLVILERLLEYRRVLAPDGTVRLRTDSMPLRDFALTQFELAGFNIAWSSDDERSEHPDEPTSEYEQRLVGQGARVYGVWATPDERPDSELEGVEQSASLSLVDYIPQDLFEGEYVPHGMAGTIVNLRNRKIHDQRNA